MTFSEVYLHILIDFGESKHLSENLRFRSPKFSPTDFGNLNTTKFDPIFTPWMSTVIAKVIKFSNRERPEYCGYGIWFLIAFGVFDVFSVKVTSFFTVFFYRFFEISGIIDQPHFARFHPNYFYGCRLILSNYICSDKLMSIGKHV